jgi:SAM-dependent methyltransferase
VTSTRVATTYTDSDAAAAYWAYQRQIGIVGGALSRWKYLPHVNEDDVVLDFGCGGGYLLAGLPGRMKLGVEPNPYARAEASRQGIYTYPSAAEVESYCVDVVISDHTFEHTLSPLDELRELWRALRPGGRLVVCVPAVDWRAKRQRDLRREDPSHEFFTWTPRLYHNLLSEAGFQPQRVELLTHAWHPRLSPRLTWLPRVLYDAHAWVLAAALRRREVYAVASRPNGD